MILRNNLMLGMVGRNTIPEIGKFWREQGGFMGAYYQLDIGTGIRIYALIISDKSAETILPFYALTQRSISNTYINDGLANTNSLMRTNQGAASFPAAGHCSNLRLEDKDDWYLPSYQELRALYYNLKPSTNANNTTTNANPSNPNAFPPLGRFTSKIPGITTVEDFIFNQSQTLYNNTNGNASLLCTSTVSRTNTFRTVSMLNGGVGEQTRVEANAVVRPIRRVRLKHLEN